MNEFSRLPEAGALPESVQLLQDMLSDSFREQRTQWLQERLRGDHDSAYGHVNRLIDRAGQQRDSGIAAGKQGDTARERTLYDGQKHTEAVMNTIFGAEAVNEVSKVRAALNNALDPEGPLKFWGEEASQLFGKLTAGTEPVEDGLTPEMTPPASQPEADAATYQNYLRQKRFIPTYQLEEKVSPGSLQLTLDEVVDIPLANVVSADGFLDWTGGTGGKAYTNAAGESFSEAPPVKVIMDYAQRETPAPPLSGEVTAFIQPDGNVVFCVHGGNHRTAAAIAKGEPTLKATDTINVRLLTENLI